MRHLLPFCTDRQAEIINAVMRDGGIRPASRSLGINKKTVHQAIKSAEVKAARGGVAPEYDATHATPPGYALKGTSTLYGPEGEIRQQWVKTEHDREAALRLMEEAAEALCETIPRATAAKAPKATQKELATVYTITDAHVGARAWREEAGADWDLKIAESTLAGCFDAMVDQSPAADIAVVSQLGDFLHQDGMNAVTPTSGHLLDADGRYVKVVRVAVKILRRMVDNALRKHARVLVLMAEGNHDIASSVWLRTLFAALYENEPRVTVIESPLPYYAWQHGQTMLCWHHGHLRKNDQLPPLFAAQFPAMWGETRYRYAHTGHRHHVEEREHSGMTVIQHPTLAARDAYAARGGWIADRAASAITYHRQYGQVGRVTVTPEMVE